MGTKAKSFETGELVEVQRAVGVPWEPATYTERMRDMRGWHRVHLDPASRPRYIDRTSGVEWMAPNENTFESWRVLVPSQRVRKAKP